MTSIDEQFVQHSRLLRPFPLKRLADTLYHVQAEAQAINHALIRLQTDPPRLPEDWADELERLNVSLASLEARCADARPALGVMVDQADGDFRRAMSGLVAMVRGLQAQEPPTQAAA
jgi:hypothetical protein